MISKWLSLILLIILVSLHYRLWVGEGSVAALWNLKGKLAEQQALNLELSQRNEILKAEVMDLKQGFDAIEERARNELGMIKADETFYQLIEPAKLNPPDVNTGNE